MSRAYREAALPEDDTIALPGCAKSRADAVKMRRTFDMAGG